MTFTIITSILENPLVIPTQRYQPPARHKRLFHSCSRAQSSSLLSLWAGGVRLRIRWEKKPRAERPGRSSPGLYPGSKYKGHWVQIVRSQGQEYQVSWQGKWNVRTGEQMRMQLSWVCYLNPAVESIYILLLTRSLRWIPVKIRGTVTHAFNPCQKGTITKLTKFLFILEPKIWSYSSSTKMKHPL